MNEEFRIAERQYGVVTRTQLRTQGLSDNQIDRRIASQRLETVFPAVFRVVGTPAGPRQIAMAATLWLADGHVSHMSAGALFRLDGITSTDELHMTVRLSNRQGRTRSLILHRSPILPNERRVVDGLRCTSPARTLVDCAAMLDDEQLEAAYEAARRMGLATADTVARAMVSAGRRPGVARIRRILAVADTLPTESRLEVRLARLLRDSDLPSSVAQFRIGRYRVDRAGHAGGSASKPTAFSITANASYGNATGEESQT